MKKAISILLAIVLVFALAACGEKKDDTKPAQSPSGSSAPATTSSAPATTSAAPANPSASAAAPEVSSGDENKYPWNPANIRSQHFILAHGMAPENVVSKCYHAFCEYVKELSDGKMEIEEMINGTLLKDLDTFNGLRDGTADFIHSMGSYVSSTVVDLSPLTIAGYYGGDDWLDFAFGTKDLVSQIYADYNIKYLGALYQGTSVIACSEKQIKQPGDVKGLPWRASGDWVIKTIEAWGGAATNISLPNLADAFQKGTVVGVTTGWTIIGGWGIWEVAKYLTTTDICEGFAALLMNGDVWAKLNADEQALLEYAGDMFVRNNFELTKVACQEYYDKIKAEGKNELYQLPAADNRKFIEIAYSLYPEMEAGGTLGSKGLELIKILRRYNGIS